MKMNASARTTSGTDSDDTDNCFILGMNATIPWDNPHNLISLEAEQTTERIKSAILIPLLFLIGAPLNLVNMAVFFKQGLKERIVMCLFSLAVADLVVLLVIFVPYAERVLTQFTTGEKYGAVYRYMMENHVMGLFGFLYGPTLLSAVISTERCVCVLFPLQAQRCMPTKVLAAVITIGVCLLGFTRFVITPKYHVSCFYEERTGRRSWQVFVSDYPFQNRKILTTLDGIVYGFGVVVGCPVVVLATTVITAIKLQQIVRWRSDKSSGLSTKEIAVTKMLICLSLEIFILSLPITILRVLPMFVPQLSAVGLYANTLLTLISFAELCSFTSSSVNFFVYYFTGSRYRETLRALFGRQPSTLGKRQSDN